MTDRVFVSVFDTTVWKVFATCWLLLSISWTFGIRYWDCWLWKSTTGVLFICWTLSVLALIWR